MGVWAKQRKGMMMMMMFIDHLLLYRRETKARRGDVKLRIYGHFVFTNTEKFTVQYSL